jgi:hypothetical protein
MKKIILLFGIITLLIFLHPSTETYEARITGQVKGDNKNPLIGAVVKRRSEIVTHGPGGVYISRWVYSGQAVTDASGKFALPERKRAKWWHPPEDYFVPWIHCYAFIEVSAKGYKTYVSEFGDNDLTALGNEAGACNGIRFQKDVTLPSSR